MVVLVEVTLLTTGFWLEVMLILAVVDFLARRLTTTGFLVVLVLIVTVLLETALFLLGFGATPFTSNFPLEPLRHSVGLAKVLRR